MLGIIGKNGAGKSTLLKILSKVTTPSTGTIKARGRIASLLEVGTGSHPEMTGRENIYMNGAIMGMTKAEISRKFDEIVDFSGVERYIDTPAKRYSSGMTVRLGFAIAAHLDPEILVVDEVLARQDLDGFRFEVRVEKVKGGFARFGRAGLESRQALRAWSGSQSRRGQRSRRFAGAWGGTARVTEGGDAGHEVNPCGAAAQTRS